jgi:5-methylcytosine-specific restriction enzyme subunit McrC
MATEPLVDVETSEDIVFERERIQPRKLYEGEEHGEINVPISDLIDGGKLNLYPEITKRGVFRIFPRKDQLVFQAGSFIGIIPINEKVTIDVRSRVPNRNLDRVLSISEHLPLDLSPHSRHFAAHKQRPESLLDAFANALLREIDTIRSYGRIKQYLPQDLTTSFPKGKILLGPTLRKHFAKGVCHRVEARWYEYTTDNPLNRCLKYALFFLATRYLAVGDRAGKAQILSRLNDAYLFFGNVTLDHAQKFFAEPLVEAPEGIPELRAYYRNAVAIAKAVIHEHGVSFQDAGTEFRLGSLLLNMEDAFEKYLRNILKSHTWDMPNLELLDGNLKGEGGGRKRLFDEGHGSYTGDATPDIVIQSNTAVDELKRFPLVIDVKYKVITGTARREDIEQVVAYAISYGAKRALIIYPRAPGVDLGGSLVGQLRGLEINQYVFDLGREDIENQETEFFKYVLSLSSTIPP